MTIHMLWINAAIHQSESELKILMADVVYTQEQQKEKKDSDDALALFHVSSRSFITYNGTQLRMPCSTRQQFIKFFYSLRSLLKTGIKTDEMFGLIQAFFTPQAGTMGSVPGVSIFQCGRYFRSDAMKTIHILSIAYLNESEITYEHEGNHIFAITTDAILSWYYHETTDTVSMFNRQIKIRHLDDGHYQQDLMFVSEDDKQFFTIRSDRYEFSEVLWMPQHCTDNMNRQSGRIRTFREDIVVLSRLMKSNTPPREFSEFYWDLLQLRFIFDEDNPISLFEYDAMYLNVNGNFNEFCLELIRIVVGIYGYIPEEVSDSTDYSSTQCEFSVRYRFNGNDAVNINAANERQKTLYYQCSMNEKRLSIIREKNTLDSLSKGNTDED